MLRVGLTGNIGSGKSTAALILAELGARIIDADSIGHELLAPGSATHASVVAAFGENILKSDGVVNRKVLGEIVFKDPGMRRVLDDIVHPGVRSEIRRHIDEMESREPRAIVVVDAALMIETSFYRFFDRVIVVTCDPDIQLARVVQRDGLSVEEVRARMAAQMPAERKAKLADYRIETSGSPEETRSQVAAVYQDLLRVERMKQARAGT